ncbi:HAD family hydrolase [Oscillatoria sp. CS-180]|uniref:HAD family hydrolase n=1 Tax=Oscillatoria sp. CS-180 TaxID=3021720 RepID=UPI002330DDA7|nr:HAD family hydrolase [Oscillatoria sp. CS-180]MDB9526616.1 HAD family hydrolase [Oscillatoria sp. CS-180]
MRYHTIATDYDGTLAADGQVDDNTWAAISSFRDRGGKVLLVTGREFEDLQQVCPELRRFDAVIAENGGVVYWPDSDSVMPQGERPPEAFQQRLRERGVDPIRCGRVIMATWQPHGHQVETVILDMQLPYHVILNKRAVMILPVGVDKASTLKRVLGDLNIAPDDTIAIGDAENDISLLEVCGLGVAVDNALPAVKAIADYVTTGSRGDGVQDLIHKLLEDKLDL